MARAGKTKHEVMIICAGADCFARPGTSIVGGQAVFARSLAEKIHTLYPTTLVTLAFVGDQTRVLPAAPGYVIREIPLPGVHYDAFLLWENYPYILRSCRKYLKRKNKNLIVITVYWLSGKIILDSPSFVYKKWLHTNSSFAVQKRIMHASSGKPEEYLAVRGKVEKKIAERASFVWVTCQYEKQLVERQMRAEKGKILLLPRTADKALFFPKEKVFDRTRWDILYIGRLDARKGIYDIPVILRYLRKKYSVGIIGGNEQESAEYQRWFCAAFPDNLQKHEISFIPAVDHTIVPLLLKETKALLAPSRYETFANVVLEAHMCHVIVIASCVGGMAERIHNGINGYLFQPGDFKEAAYYIEKSLSRKQWEKMTKQRIFEFANFSWDCLLAKLQEVIL